MRARWVAEGFPPWFYRVSARVFYFLILVCLGSSFISSLAHPDTCRPRGVSPGNVADAVLWTGRETKNFDAQALKTPLTTEQLCQRRGATFARVRMEAQLYCLRAAATRLTGKYWAAPYASSLLARSRSRGRCGVGAFAPAPAAHVRASRQWCGPGTSLLEGFTLKRCIR